MDPNCLIPGDATLIENIVNYLKAKGIFDEFRHECLADIDTKSSCQNLSQRVDGYTSKFLGIETWHPDLNKNELRNKLRRHIDEAGFLAPGADIVVEQAVNPKVYHYFFPKVIEVVHQYIKEQSELLIKKPETAGSSKISSVSEKPLNDAFENKDKTQISDPIADILSFSFHAKSESVQHKHGDTSKVEKKKEEKNIPAVDKNTLEVQGEAVAISVNEAKVQLEKEKEKLKKEDPEIQQEVPKKTVKDEMKAEKKKTDDVKASVSETTAVSEESKSSVPVSSKPNVSLKKDDKTKHKSKSQNLQKSSSSSSEIKKPKKESSEKSSDKVNKSKPAKSSKESSSPTKISSSMKSVFKDEKGESSKTKSHDTSSSKTSESSMKKSKSNHDRKESSSSKHKGHGEKTDKPKVSKSNDKNEPHIHHDSSNSEKGTKNIQYSSSYDSSQGSDQEKSTSTNLKKERSKHFSKHASKENPDNSNKTDKKRSNNGDESNLKKYKNEKDAKLKLKDTSAVEAAKISSRSNSFGSTSSVSSSSNASKDNLTSNSDEVSENSTKDKKKKQPKEKDSCQNSPKSLPPPPPPPPPSSSLTSEFPSSAEMSSVEDTQSSLSDSETSSNEEISEESSSDSELESKDLINDTLNENSLNSSSDNINAFYDIFLYSSSSSEFEGYGNSPEKKNAFKIEFENMHDSDLSISSVHTSDLSSYDDELSSDDEVAVLTGGLKKRLTLKEARDLIENRAVLNEKKKVESKTQIGGDSFNKRRSQRSSSLVSSEDELPSPEPVRSLRRERKLNPRYSSSEYTSIFNCKKETFITKQTSPSIRNQTSTPSPKVESKLKKADSFAENNKMAKESLVESKTVKMHSDGVETSEKNKSKLKKEPQDKKDQLSSSKMSSSDELDSIMDTEKLFKENNKNNLITDDDKLKDHKKLKTHNNTKVRKNSQSLKRKLEVAESTPMKRPCSRSSVDSSSSEFAPNENKPFNSEKKDANEEKKLNDCSLKVSNLNIGVKKDLFCKQRTNNNGDILGQKDIFPKNSHSKVINNSENKTNESDTGKELSSL